LITLSLAVAEEERLEALEGGVAQVVRLSKRLMLQYPELPSL